MQLPEVIDIENDRMVYKLNKTLCGLKQAARCWNKFHEFLQGFNFQQSSADHCVYLGQFEGEKVYLFMSMTD